MRQPTYERLRVIGAAALTTTAAIGCSSQGQASACTTPASTACAPLYDPTYEQIFTRTLKPTCAAGGTSCHSAGKGGFLIDDIDATYARISERLTPSKPECSLVVDRLYSTETGYAMPPGAQLTEAERCSIVQWIAAGAKR
jgi:hypothetical protein